MGEEYRARLAERKGRLGKATYVDRNGYIFKWDRIVGRPVRLHRYVWEMYNGPIPDGYIVHHKNGNKKCNCIANLELVTAKEHNNVKHNRSEEVREIWAKRTPEQRAAIVEAARTTRARRHNA